MVPSWANRDLALDSRSAIDCQVASNSSVAFSISESGNSSSCPVAARCRRSSHSMIALVTWPEASSGTGTEMPVDLRISRCLRIRTSRTLPSMPLSLP